MPDANAARPLRYLRIPEAARPLSLSGRTLAKHRCYDTRPRYPEIGGRVVYRIDDLRAWAERGAKRSNSDETVNTVLPAKWHAALAPLYRDPSR